MHMWMCWRFLGSASDTIRSFDC